MSENFDLLGDPIPENWGKRGRPQHIPTVQNRNKVMLLLALMWGDERIARALSITAPTLRKHYFRELRYRDEARDRLDANLAAMLWEQSKAGNVAAVKEFRKLTERADLISGRQAFYDRPEKPVKPPKLGKKDRAALAAETAGENSGWGDDLKVGRRAN